ncbi:Serine/threonine protein kinase [hydrothermal vent metagenome]|uniref:Serine/threonine protein kinase n=1 Tax=hydrothermal vent metagenome TaxID=652676 RepID=A0A3B1BWK4_9ZZZZ
MPEIESLGRYEIISELGRGGMGIVMKGKDPKIDRLVALKIIKFEDIADSGRIKELIERFHIEARAAGKLTHPSIVTIYDVGEQSGMSFIAMEFVEGRDLADILRKEKKMPFKRAANLIIQIAEGLAFAHERGIIHRDIKPGNILIQKNDKVKITDFGLARLQSAGSVTQTGHAVGSPLYMSPEQVQSLPMDGRSDIFSLGVMFYELVTGVKPFEADSLTGIIFKIIKDDPLPPTTFNKRLSSSAEAVIKKMMAKDPEQRYRSGGDVAGDLKRISSFPDGFGDLTGSDAAMTLDFAVSDTVSTDGAPQKSKGLLWAIALLSIAVSVGGAWWYLQGAKRQAVLPELAVKAPEKPASDSPPIPERLTPDNPPKDAKQAVATPAKPEAPEPVAILKGFVAIDSPIESEITIDGIAVGATPITSLELDPGKHTIEARADSFKPWKKEIKISSGKLVTLTADMKLADGFLKISSLPKGALVFINGEKSGRAPVKIELAAGDHKVTIKKPGYRSFTKKIKIKSAKTAEISAKLDKLGFGSLRVTAIPWADIYINNNKIGPTPRLIEKAQEGKISIKLVNPGFEPYSKVAWLKKGERLEIFHKFTEAEALTKPSGKSGDQIEGETGSLKITSKPSGMVFIDGKAEGETPVIATGLAIGPHEIVIKREGQEDYNRSVIVIKRKVILLAVE